MVCTGYVTIKKRASWVAHFLVRGKYGTQIYATLVKAVGTTHQIKPHLLFFCFFLLKHELSFIREQIDYKYRLAHHGSYLIHSRSF
jgi:hypothetical protein